MADKKAAVEVKQEGDFKMKKPKRKAKNLGKSNDEPVKVDFTKPEAQGEVVPDVVKVFVPGSIGDIQFSFIIVP